MVEDPEVLDGLHTVQPAAELVDSGLHMSAHLGARRPGGVVGGRQSFRPAPIGQRVGVQAAPGPGGVPIQQQIEVRQVLGAPDPEV